MALPPDTPFTERMKQCVQKVGSIYRLSQISGIHKNTLSKYLRGTEPSRLNLVAISEAAGVSISWLAAGEDLSAHDMEKQESSPDKVFTPPARPRTESGEAQNDLVEVPSLWPQDDAGNSRLEMVEGETWAKLNRSWVRNHLRVEHDKLAAVQVPDDAMAGTLEPTDWVIIDLTERKNREGLYYIIFGQTVAIRFTTGDVVDGVLRFVGREGHLAEINVPLVDLGTKVRLVGRVLWAGRYFGGSVYNRVNF